MTQPAPLFSNIAEGPAGARAFWLRAQDGVRIRSALWPAPVNAKGTVFMLPGRTEYIEKYGRSAGDLAQRGYAMACIDWRGQGLADRALPDPMAGHVVDFAEYQRDLQALIDLAETEAMPKPWYMLAHSMGGCIGLRCLMGDHPFKAAAFSAPMWGILIAAWMRPLAVILSTASRWFHFDGAYAPGTGAGTYVLDQSFAGNTLTTDAEMWDYMRSQALAHPELSLGGPSLGWLKAALVECSALAMMAAPDVAVISALGTSEKIVDVGPIHTRMAAWPRGQIRLYPGAEHEIMMERPNARSRFFDEAAALFSASP